MFIVGKKYEVGLLLAGEEPGIEPHTWTVLAVEGVVVTFATENGTAIWNTSGHFFVYAREL